MEKLQYQKGDSGIAIYNWTNTLLMAHLEKEGNLVYSWVRAAANVWLGWLPVALKFYYVYSDKLWLQKTCVRYLLSCNGKMHIGHEAFQQRSAVWSSGYLLQGPGAQSTLIWLSLKTHQFMPYPRSEEEQLATVLKLGDKRL